MKVIGITGSSGSGKSTVAKIVKEELNAKLIVADEIVKKMQQPGNKYFEQIVKFLGEDYLNNEGKLNRKKVAKLIFKDQEIRIKINNLTQKYVVAEIKKEIEKAEHEYVVIDVPLLIESGLNKMCNLVIGVTANKDEQIKRICKRDGLTQKEALARLEAQPNNEFYKKNIKFIIENNGGEYDKLLGRIRLILQEL